MTSCCCLPSPISAPGPMNFSLTDIAQMLVIPLSSYQGSLPSLNTAGGSTPSATLCISLHVYIRTCSYSVSLCRRYNTLFHNLLYTIVEAKDVCRLKKKDLGKKNNNCSTMHFIVCFSLKVDYMV